MHTRPNETKINFGTGRDNFRFIFLFLYPEPIDNNIAYASKSSRVVTLSDGETGKV